MDCDLLLVNAKILKKPGAVAIMEKGYISVTAGVINEIGEMKSLPADFASVMVLDVSGCMVLPGLVNSHCHSAMSLFRGLADDIDMMTWLQDHIFPAEASFVNREMVYWCSLLAAAEMLMSGTTVVADGYFFEQEAARAFSDIGMRAVAAQGVIDFPAPGVPDPAYNIQVARDFIDSFENGVNLVQPGLFCHSPYTCSPETIVAAKDLSKSKNVPFFMHVAETKAESEQIRKEYGFTPVQHLHDLGVLDSDTVCVHCVWLDEKDIDVLAQTKTSVVTCPESNMKLAAGIAPVSTMLEKGITVGLGTDGCASNNNLDIFGEMDTLAKLHKVVGADASRLKASQALGMATRDGVEAIGYKGNMVGELVPGGAADMIVVDLQRPHFTPFYNTDLLVYSAGGADVRDVIVGGRVVMKNRRLTTIDVGEVMCRVKELAKPVCSLSR